MRMYLWCAAVLVEHERLVNHRIVFRSIRNSEYYFPFDSPTVSPAFHHALQPMHGSWLGHAPASVFGGNGS